MEGDRELCNDQQLPLPWHRPSDNDARPKAYGTLFAQTNISLDIGLIGQTKASNYRFVSIWAQGTLHGYEDT